ncbi:MAG: DNA cytosine methyltransferase [Candidatus Heimdallarchaeota archaeon]
MAKLKVLNLYAGIGGNRKLWPDDEIEVTAIDNNPEIAKIYQDFFPNDKIIVADAHQYLLEHFKEFDFIWSSPPCPSHSVIRRMNVDIGGTKPIYPDMQLYEEIIFLIHFCKCKWVVENVISYYEPLIKPQVINRHYFWSNFFIGKIILPSANIEYQRTQPKYGFNLTNYKIKEKTKILRNLVNPQLGLYTFKCAFKEKQLVLNGKIEFIKQKGDNHEDNKKQ